MNNRNSESGAVSVIEATFVFPVMFIILLILLYMGNMFYMRSRVDAIVTEYAVRAASRCTDPFLDEIEANGSVPTRISDVKPYNNILGGNSSAIIRTEMINTLNRQGTGFFAGMGLREISINKFEKNNTLVTNTFTADVTYKIKMPIRFLGSNKPISLTINSVSVVSLTDTTEFIRDVDMAIDFLEAKGIDKKLSAFSEKVKKFLK